MPRGYYTSPNATVNRVRQGYAGKRRVVNAPRNPTVRVQMGRRAMQAAKKR